MQNRFPAAHETCCPHADRNHISPLLLKSKLMVETCDAVDFTSRFVEHVGDDCDGFGRDVAVFRLGMLECNNDAASVGFDFFYFLFHGFSL